jgi:hypothetical protein
VAVTFVMYLWRGTRYLCLIFFVDFLSVSRNCRSGNLSTTQHISLESCKLSSPNHSTLCLDTNTVMKRSACILYEHIIYICNPQSQLFLFVCYLTTCSACASTGKVRLSLCLSNGTPRYDDIWESASVALLRLTWGSAVA